MSDSPKPRKSSGGGVNFDDDLHIKSQTIRTKLHGKADPVLVEIIALQAEELASCRRNIKILGAQFNALKDLSIEIGGIAQVAVDELNKDRGERRKGVSVASEPTEG